MSSHTSTLAPAATIERHDGYTIQHFAPITIGSTVFAVREQIIDGSDTPVMWITGPRGADYTLERTNRPGVYVAQSFTSGQPMKRQGNVVLINWAGDIIEQA